VRSSHEGHFMERFAPGSLAKTLSEGVGRLRFLLEHGLDPQYGRRSVAQVMEVEDTDEGPAYRAELLRGLTDQIMDGLGRGLYGTSIAFRPLRFQRVRKPEPSETNPEGIEERTVTEAQVRELSLVTFPQYAGATASLRSLTDELSVARLMEHPDHLLQLVKERAEIAPPHSEPAEAEDQPPDTGSRDTRSKPKKDWLSTEEVSRPWQIP
jgi:HK97 family phage prohead protease